VLREASKLWRLQDRLGDFTIHKTDLADYEAVSAMVNAIRPATVYHLATYGAYAHQKDQKLCVQTNILGTMNIVNACRDCVSRIINVSSSSEYGVKDHPIHEDDVLEPNSVYGMTKAAATHYCSHMARENGMPITTFRIFAAYGYYEEPMRLMPSLIVPYLKKHAPRLSNPDSVRDYIFIEDIIEALERASVSKKAQGEILNLGCGKQHSISELVSIVKSLLDSDIEPLWGSIGNRQPEPKIWVADISKTKKVLQWEPSYSLKKGLEKTVSWYRENLELYSSHFE
jgi:nucleoside-diphosphate-sugar epimerase